MLTPKEIRGQGAAKVFPHEIENSALIESSYTIPGTVATDATISLCFKPTAATVAIMIDGSAHHHLVIQKTGTTVKLWKNGKALPDYTGTVGATYGDLLKNVLTALSGSYYGYYSELHVVEQSLEPSIFGEFTDLVTGLWVLKVFIVPTSIHDLGNIATSGVATAKSMQSGYLPSRLNDGLYADNTTLWQSGIGDVTNVWVEIDFGATHEIEQYGMVGNQYSSIITRAPKTWVTELYVDGEWVTVDTQTNVVAWGVGAKRDYALGARYSASKIRVTVNSNQGDTQNTTIGELFVYAVEDITYGDGGGYYNFANALKLGEEFAQGKTVKDYGDNKLVSGTPSGTTGYVSWTIEKAFDGSKSTAHAIALGSHPYANGVYTQYKVGTVFIPGKYLIASSGMSGTSYTSWVKAWEFQATNDNWATYDVLDAQSGQTFGNKVSREYVITPGSTAYTDFRIKHLASNHVNYTDVAEFKVWAAPQMVSPNDATITGTQTVDTMTDTQPTWDRLLPAFYSGGSMTYSNGNRTVAYVLNNATALTTPIPVNGKWAARMEWAVAANKNNTFCGICDDEYLHSSGANGNVFGYAPTGDKNINATVTAYGASYTNADDIDIKLDMDAGELRFEKGGVDQGVAYNASIVGKRWHFMCYITGACTLTYNPDATPPTGYKALCSTNLPDPAIMNSKTVADVVTRVGSGDGSTMIDRTLGTIVGNMDNAPYGGNEAAFDGVRYPASWADIAYSTPLVQCYLGKTFPTAKTVTKIFMSGWASDGLIDGGATVVNVRLMGSNDGVNVNGVEIYATGTYADHTSDHGFVVPNPQAFTSVWVELTGQGGTRPMVGELEFYEGFGTIVDLPLMEGGPDFVNMKNRSEAFGWNLVDTLRGAGNTLFTNATAPSTPDINRLTTFMPTGYSLSDSYSINKLNNNFLDLCLKAGVEQGFDIQTAIIGATTTTVPHGLGKRPTFILWKCISSANHWFAWHPALGNDKFLLLNETDGADTSVGWCVPSSTDIVFSAAIGNPGDEYIAYIWTDSDIFKAFSYIGNGNADGPFVNLGGEPWSIPFLKNSSGVFAWNNQDFARSPFNPVSKLLYPNYNYAEDNNAVFNLEFTSTGFKIANSSGGWNRSGDLMIGLAIKKRTSKYPQGF